jgi:hypothetical protein
MASSPAPHRSAEQAVADGDGVSRTDVAEKPLSAEELSATWTEWVDHGPQGPIEDEDGESEAP